MLEYNDKCYAIDMDKLMEWVALTPPGERNNTITISKVSILDEDGETQIPQKETTETQSDLNDSMNTVRYDFVRNLLTILFTPIVTDNGAIVTTPTFGQTLAFNSLVKKGIIIEIDKYDKDEQ